MLCLSRKLGEIIVIDGGIEIKVVSVRGGKVKIGIVAPASARIVRKEVYVKPEGKS